MPSRLVSQHSVPFVSVMSISILLVAGGKRGGRLIDMLFQWPLLNRVMPFGSEYQDVRIKLRASS